MYVDISIMYANVCDGFKYVRVIVCAFVHATMRVIVRVAMRDFYVPNVLKSFIYEEIFKSFIFLLFYVCFCFIYIFRIENVTLTKQDFKESTQPDLLLSLIIGGINIYELKVIFSILYSMVYIFFNG